MRGDCIQEVSHDFFQGFNFGFEVGNALFVWFHSGNYPPKRPRQIERLPKRGDANDPSRDADDPIRDNPGATRDDPDATRGDPDATRGDLDATRDDPDATRDDPGAIRDVPDATRDPHDPTRDVCIPLNFALATPIPAGVILRAILPPSEEGPNPQNQQTKGAAMLHLDSNPPIFFDAGIFFDAPPPATPKHTMANILRNWSKLGRKDRLAFGKTIETNLGKTPAPVASPNPTVAQLGTLYTAADTLINEVDDLETQLKAKRSARDAALDALMAGVEQEAKTIEAIPGVTDEVILAVGFAIAGVPQPAPAIMLVDRSPAA